MKILITIAALQLSLSLSFAADWSRNAQLPGDDDTFSAEPRTNIYQLPPAELEAAILAGRHYVFHYPVEVTELMIPYKAMVTFFDETPDSRFKRWLYAISKDLSGFSSTKDVTDWLGIQAFPESRSAEGPGPWPEVHTEERKLGMGATLINRDGAEGLTFSCAACHSADLFGKKIIGLTNRFPRANEFFGAGKRFLPFAHPDVFQELTGASDAEAEILRRSRYAVRFVGVKKPQVLGLDTSLAQVALSLARRGKDEYAKRSALSAQFPRHNELENHVADSKPAVWWNVKYKTRWLSDGSIVAGNPIHTNFLWNEIGRGIDLKELERWLDANIEKVEQLTAAVFATEAPYYLDHLPADTLDVELAKQGQPVFANTCARCHGEYEKAWDSPAAALMPLSEQVKTTRVWYHKKTPVHDVGTDPGRYLGMKYFAEDLNRLKISRTLKTIVEPQKGYVPPPLVGIWARWPYFHNNSAPNLCAVLTRSSERPVTYIAGPAIDPRIDYDADCGGYPAAVPENWKGKPEYVYDTRRKGMSNQGHDEGIFLDEGRELLSPQEKRALVEFLKTL
ncbi:MAG: hypothetical protein ACLGG7_12130 [Bacteriovoracia bacterium]